MGKVLMFLSIFIPLLINLLYDSRVGLDPKTVQSQRVLVTAASTSMGQHLAYQYAKLGARLVITDSSENLLIDVAKKCMDLGAQEVRHVTADIEDPKGPSTVVEFVDKQLGGLDQLILNHAIVINDWWTGSDENMTTLEDIQRINFLSSVQLVSEAMPMLTACKGRIGIVTSGYSQAGTVGLSFYSSTMFALHGFFSSLRQEFRLQDIGVSVTFVQLGSVATDTVSKGNRVRLPEGALIPPEEAAWTVVENVSLRRYAVRHDWKLRMVMFINDLCPAFFENNLADIVVNDKSKWSTRLMEFAMREMYSA